MTIRGFGALRPRPLRRLLAGTVTTALLALGLSSLAPTPAGAVTASSMAAASDTYESQVQQLINVRRAAHGLPRLKFASCPDGTAEVWSRHLASTDEFYHQSMTSLLDKCNAMYAGETLGRGTMSPRTLVQMWMHSPPHRAVLLSSKSRRVGIGATYDAYGRWVVAANFVRY